MNTSEDLHQCFYSFNFKPIRDFTHQRFYDLLKDKECWGIGVKSRDSLFWKERDGSGTADNPH